MIIEVIKHSDNLIHSRSKGRQRYFYCPECGDSNARYLHEGNAIETTCFQCNCRYKVTFTQEELKND